MHMLSESFMYEGVLISHKPDLFPDVVGKRSQFTCRIASIFLLQRLKKSMSGDARDFNNIETRAAIKYFSCKARRRKKFTSF